MHHSIIISPQELAQHLKDNVVRYAYAQTPAGALRCGFTTLGIMEAVFMESNRLPREPKAHFSSLQFNTLRQAQGERIEEMSDTVRPEPVEGFERIGKESQNSIEQLEHLPPLVLSGTAFQIRVWQETMKIATGNTMSYQQLAALINVQQGSRAVARALATNKIAYFIPCHRVMGKDGKLRGYKWNVERKKMLLEAEKKGA